ncbi:MAG: PsiF repeat family protein [Burkholderiales bacterium]|jgi:hypothetical protein|nr:PsiF repeat family protein [Burkholderiales bacterium]
MLSIARAAAAVAIVSLMSGAMAPVVHAAEDGRTKQQELMASCNKMAAQKEVKGDDRKKFMSACLKGEVPLAPARSPQQERMANCNKDAGTKALKGDERKKFMSECLKG